MEELGYLTVAGSLLGVHGAMFAALFDSSLDSSSEPVDANDRIDCYCYSSCGGGAEFPHSPPPSIIYYLT